MIKRKAHTFYSQERLNEYLDQLPDFAKVAHFTVDDDVYYIIVEHEEVQQHKEETYYIRCDYRGDYEFTKGKEYEVLKDNNGYFILDDNNTVAVKPQSTPEMMRIKLNCKYVSSFSLFKQNAW